MYRQLTTISTLALSLAGSLTYAHEGHGHAAGQGNTPTHYLTEPFHLVQFGAVAATVLVVGWMVLRSKRLWSAKPSA